MKLRTVPHRPLIVGTLTGAVKLMEALTRARAASVDLIEVRLDTFPRIILQNSSVFLRALKTRFKKPLLLTLRSSREGGDASLTNRQRTDVIMGCLSVCDLVDVEIRETAFAREITWAAHRINKDVIHSVHDFKAGVRLSVYAAWSALSRRMGGDIFKIAVTPRNNDDLEIFLKWGLTLKNPGKVLIGMGAAGVMSRVVGFSFGSLLTYGHLGSPAAVGGSAAPGQLSVRDLARSVRAVYGDR